MKKTLVTAAGPNMMPILDRFSLPTFERFADRHGYQIHVEELLTDDTARKSDAAKAARWQKVGLMRRILEANDVAVWFDADVLICRSDTDIASHIKPGYFQGLVLHSVPAENRVNPNTGVWAMRNSSQAFAFLDAVDAVGMPKGRWADQGAVMGALGWERGDDRYHGARMPEKVNAFLAGTTWLPIGWNQPYCENRPNPEAYEGRPLVEDPNALHFMAMTIDERKLVMGSVLSQLPIMQS